MDLDDGITLRAADDPTIKNELRRAWIADRLDERLGEFGKTHAVDVVCATWNANGKDVTKLGVDLEPWLRARAAPADVYAIGAQEMVDLTVSNVALTGAQAAKRAEASTIRRRRSQRSWRRASLLAVLAVPVCDSSFLPPLTGTDDDRISQWAFDLLEALPNAHYNVFVYVLALLREVLAKSWQTTAATRLASVARDAFLPGGEPGARAHVFSAVQFLLTSNL